MSGQTLNIVCSLAAIIPQALLIMLDLPHQFSPCYIKVHYCTKETFKLIKEEARACIDEYTFQKTTLWY